MEMCFFFIIFLRFIVPKISIRRKVQMFEGLIMKMYFLYILDLVINNPKLIKIFCVIFGLINL